MPNHVTHRIMCTGSVEDIAALKELIIVQDPEIKDPAASTFDFNQIIPMPPILERVVAPPSLGDHGRLIVYDNPHGLFGDTREATVEEQTLIDQHSPNDWYHWRLERWGTKWNAYAFEELQNHATYEFKFDTAWAPPAPVLDKIALQFPNVRLDIAWFDEGWCHAGKGVLHTEREHGSTEELYTEPTKAIHYQVYGEYPNIVEEEDKAYLESIQRAVANFTCVDVADASDKHGRYAIRATLYSDDPKYTDDQLYEYRQNLRRIAHAIE